VVHSHWRAIASQPKTCIVWLRTCFTLPRLPLFNRVSRPCCESTQTGTGSFAFIVQIKDEWFFQKDVEQQFVSFTHWGADLVPIFEKRESYVESLYSFCLPIPVGRLKKAFHETSWQQDYTSTRAKLIRPRSKHFLSRAFRNRSGAIELRWFGSFRRFYVDADTSATVALQEKHEEPAYRFTRISLSSALLTHFLADTRQALLWCVSSHRRTERNLAEFSTSPYEESIRRDECIYVRAANPITPEGKYHLPRMESCSWIVGKRRVHEIDRNT
jgi:hypothetical protein